MAKVMLFDCRDCENSSEEYRCPVCGLDGPEIDDLIASLPATDDYLFEEFPQWTGEGAITQSTEEE